MQKQLNISKQAFWDVDFDSLDPEKHKLFIVEKIFNRGTFDDIKKLLGYYGLSDVRETVTKVRYLDNKALALASLLVDVPKEKFRCFILKQSIPVHWNF